MLLYYSHRTWLRNIDSLKCNIKASFVILYMVIFCKCFTHAKKKCYLLEVEFFIYNILSLLIVLFRSFISLLIVFPYLFIIFVFLSASHLNFCDACGMLLPRPGIEPSSHTLQGELLTTGPPEKSLFVFQIHLFLRDLCKDFQL